MRIAKRPGQQQDDFARRFSAIDLANRLQLRGAHAVDDDRLSRRTPVLVFVDVGSDPAAIVVSNPDLCMARSHARQSKNRREQRRRKFHTQPSSKSDLLV